MKTIPQAPELEQTTLGAILTDREAIYQVLDVLKPETFGMVKHQHIYTACLALMAKGEGIDLLTVSNQLEADGKLSAVGGSVYLAELCNKVGSAANIEYHARIVAQKALARDLIRLSEKTLHEAYDPQTDAFDLLHRQQKESFDLANFGGRNAQAVGRISTDVLRQLDAAMRKGDGVTGVPSGITALDGLTGGWQDTDLIILAARPGMGKTAFVLNNAVRAAKSGFPVGMFSLEMSAGQLVKRIIASETGISSNLIQRGKVSGDDHRRITDAAQEMSALPIYIDDTPGLNIFEMRAKARRLKMQHGIRLLIVDYLQLMSGSDRNGSNREQEISAISRGLKALAKDLQIPVIALSQLSRAVEIRGGDKRPILSDLRESGSIEQDADIVGFMYRPEYYKIMEDDAGNSLAGFAEFIIAKHRNGAQDTVGLFFEAHTTTFYDLSRRNFKPQPSTFVMHAARVEDEDLPF
jgi:replicative DNA helicase